MLTKLQQEIREKLVIYALKNFKPDYQLSNQDIADIFTLSRQGVHKIEVRNGIKATTKSTKPKGQ